MDSKTARIMVIVKLRSRLPDEELARRYPQRMPDFRKVEGLLQKYYTRDASTGEWGGVYLFESREAVDRYLASDLRATIGSFYEVDGAPRVEIVEVIDTLHA